MPRPKRRSGVKATSRTQEKAILNRARALRKDPSLIAPSCSLDCGGCPFGKLIKGAEKIARIEDGDYIKKFFRKGDPLLRAYAVMISIDIEGKIPYLATAATPSGMVAYVYREKVDKKPLISLMYPTDPKISLMGYIPHARKHRLHLYATKNGVICTGRSHNPPDGFIDVVMKALPYQLKRKGDALVCPHEPELTVSMEGLSVSVCRKCASEEASIPIIVQNFMYVPEAHGGMNPQINWALDGKDRDCLGDFAPARKIKKGYLSGEISDARFLEDVWKTFREESERQGLYIAGNRCFGRDVESFLEGIDLPEEAMKAIRAAMEERKEGIVVDDYSANKILAEIWDDAALSVISSVSTPGIAEDILKKGQKNPVDMIREAEMLMRKRKVLKALPTYRDLTPIQSFADKAAREYKISGKDAIDSFIYSHRARDTKIKSMGLAFMLAVGEGKGKDWHYSKHEMDFAAFLAPYAKKVLEAEGEDYHRALVDLLSAAGVDSRLDGHVIGD